MNQSLHTCLIAALCACTLTSTAYAQQATQQPQKPQPPADLQWQTMNLAIFNSKHYQSTSSNAETHIARMIWKKEIDQLEKQQLPGFVLVGLQIIDGKQLMFSSLKGLDICLPAPDGKNSIDSYSICDFRVTWWNGEEAVSRTIPNFCHLYGLDKDDPPELNKTQFFYDSKSRIAYFKVIQQGKHISSCDRYIGIK